MVGRIEFDVEKDWQNIIWNNKDIRINNKSVFYKNFFESGIIYVNDLLFELNNREHVLSGLQMTASGLLMHYEPYSLLVLSSSSDRF